MNVGSVCRSVVSVLGAMLPADQRDWADALRAEVDVPDSVREKIALTVSGASGLMVLAGRSLALCWSRHLTTLGLAVAFGSVTGYVDAVSPSRWPLRLFVLGGSLALGVARPHVAVTAGGLLGLSVVAISQAAGPLGPYSHDPGDAWIPLIPAIIVAVIGARLRHMSRYIDLRHGLAAASDGGVPGGDRSPRHGTGESPAEHRGDREAR